MDEEFNDTNLFPSPNSCCPVPFLTASTSPARTQPMNNAARKYDPRLQQPPPGQTVLDMSFAPTLSDVIERDRDSEAKLAEEGRGILHFLQCFKGNATSRPFRGVMCNPLLTSRLALTGLLAVLLIVMTVLTWVFTSTNVQTSVKYVAAEFRHELLLRTNDTVNSMLQGNNASAVSLARFLNSTSQQNLSSFTNLQEQVRPALFLAYSILSRKAQVTYFGENGLFISYLADSSGTSILYANSSYLYPVSAENISRSTEIPWKDGENLTLSRPWYRWYRQIVDESTGLATGEASLVTPLPYWSFESGKSIFQDGIEIPSWGFSLVESTQVVFSSLSPVHSANSIGTVSVAVSLADIQDNFDQFDLQGGEIYIATGDGRLVAQTGVPFTSYRTENATQSWPYATQSNNAIVAGAAEYLTTQLANETFMAVEVEVQGTRYVVDSAPLHVAGTTLICVVIIPYNSIWGPTQKRSHTTLAVLVALATCMGLVGCFFVVLLTKGVSNEMRLRAALIQQLEETKRAETKSSHKSLVFANMSHDLRTPLAAILGLIDLCLSDASERSELESNLQQMKSCATNLLGILNTILDMSKIEAGKMMLQESGFDLVCALEEIVDTFSVVGMKKGIEVVLDLSDGTVEKASWVVGDVGRVKQIMANLLSNGVKFTSEGHVVLRAWVKPVGVTTARPRFRYRGRLLAWPWNQFFRSPSIEKEICKLIQGFSEQDHEEDHVEIEFEVDDTGRGIPKERWKSVFENFVQVETAVPRNYDGTGLGLGIVRSLVQLMGGHISIIEKDEPGEPGTRFRFNLIFKCDKQYAKSGGKEGHIHGISVQNGAFLKATFGVNSTSVSQRWHLDSKAAPVLSQGLEAQSFNSPPIAEGVHVLLAMQGQAGKRVVKKWMERRGLQVWTIGRWEEFSPTVERIKQDICFESLSTSERFDFMSPENPVYDSWVEDLDSRGLARTRTSTDASLQLPLSDRSTAAGFVQNSCVHQPRAHLLIIIDITMAMVSLESLCSDLEDILLEVDQPAMFKVVWLVNADTPSADIQYLRKLTTICSLILHKPLYASRLQSIWELLQELVGNRVQKSCEGEALHLPSGICKNVDFSTEGSLYTSLSCMHTFHQERSLPSQLMKQSNLKARALSDKDGSCFALEKAGSDIAGQDSRYLLPRRTNVERWSPPSMPDRHPEKMQVLRGRSRVDDELMVPQHVLSCMHILVAEDNPVLQRLTKTQLIRLGATVVCVDNGADAARLVLENLYKSKVSPFKEDGTLSADISQRGMSKNQPFDLVLMDCEMPILNGYEATKRIRVEEGRYKVRTPVIALTAHAMAEDEKKCIEAGMDFYLTKPLAIDALVDVVTKITGARTFENT